MNHEFKDDMLPRKHFLSLQIDLQKFSPATDEEKQQHETMRESTTFFRDGMRKLMKNPLAVASLIVLIILTLSNIFISLLRKIIPNEVRIACYIVVIAGFVTIVDLCLQAFVPAIAESLGVFIPLIVVNCIILGRAEAFASKNSVAASAVDGICQGIGYTVVLLILRAFRELLGAGTLLGIQIMPSSYVPAGMLTLPVGGFLCLGTLIAIMQWALARSEKKNAEKKETEGK